MEKTLEEPDLNYIPICGFLNNFHKLEKPLDYIGLPKGIEADFAIINDDNCNEPLIPKNSILIIKRVQSPIDILNNDFVLVKIEENYYIRKLTFKNDKIYLKAINESCQSFIIDIDEMKKIIGNVVYIIIRLKV